MSSPAIAGPSLSSAAAKPQAELSNAAGKAKQAAKEVGDAVPSARKGALAPDAEGQRREYTAVACSAEGVEAQAVGFTEASWLAP